MGRSNARTNGRRVIITTKDNTVIHAEGLSKKELEEILKNSISLSAIDHKSQRNDKNQT
jgi:hypothetical protein